MNKLILTFTLAFIAGNFIATYGHENEWTTTQIFLTSSSIGIIIGILSHYTNL